MAEQALENRPPEGKLSDLEEVAGGQLYYFPQDLPSLDHWVAFRISKDVKFRRDQVRKQDTQATIILPMPANLGTQYSSQYNAEGVGPLGDFAAGQGANIRRVVEGQMSGGEFVNSLVDAFTGPGAGAGLKGGLMNLGAQAAEEEIGALIGGAISNSLGGAAVGAAAGQAFKAGLAGAGIARNPHLATLFTGVNFRSHSFEYKLVPRNRFESNRLRFIIQKLKYHMAPSYAAEGHFFNYPEQFDIEFHYPNYLFDIGASVLTDFSVNYHGEGASYYFDETNAPVSVSLNMTFQELTINTKENIGKRPGGR
jgi:hypothetical protein